MALLFDETTRTTEPGGSVTAQRAETIRPPAVTAAAGGASLLRAISRARTKLGRHTRVRRGVGVGLLVDPGKRYDPRLAPLATSAGATDLGLLLPAPWVSAVVAVDRPSDARPVLAYAARATTVGPDGPAFFPLPVEHGNALAGGFGRDAGRSVVDVVGRLDAALARAAARRCPRWRAALAGRYDWAAEAAADEVDPGDWRPVGYAAVPAGHPALAGLTSPAVDPARGLVGTGPDGWSTSARRPSPTSAGGCSPGPRSTAR
ncbi:MAG: hypothetical protein U0871_19870 [Gemmataceae bacterium]